MSREQTAIPCAYLRGGSSKATFFIAKNLPKPGALRDRILKRVNGTPDPIQIDGMGGSRVITSKIAIISTSDRDDADIDYTFCQVGIDTDTIEYAGNCGNISGMSKPTCQKCLHREGTHSCSV
jgi:2-methylaconitate cis-trans-isomerase PrpF